MEQKITEELKHKNNKGINIKIFIIIGIVILLQIVVFFINSLVVDREDAYNVASNNISTDWGAKQGIAAPFLIAQLDNDKTYVILPDELNMNADVKTEVKRKGIYQTNVYTTNMGVNGYFSKSKLPENIKYLYMGIHLAENKGIVNIEKFKFGNIGKDLGIESGTKNSVFNTGISSVKIDENLITDKMPFDINFSFRGSTSLSLYPLGEKNNFTVSSNWNSPNFKGILPAEHKIDENGFTASWTISNLSRNYPQVIEVKKVKKDGEYEQENYMSIITNENEEDYSRYSYENPNTYKSKVIFMDGITSYRQILRSTKYGILFVFLTIVVIYIFDLIKDKKTHFIQYGVVTSSLVIFYLLLLALSEHINFGFAYLISSLAVIVPNTLYYGAITSSKKMAAIFGIFLTAIYSILYSMLNMEQYALLVGTIIILIILYIAMYITRKTEILEKLS